jgi:hypothetical protein
MPESRKNALRKAKRLGFKPSSVTKASPGRYFIAPKGLTKKGAKGAYASCRDSGGSAEKCARIAWSVEKK